MPDILSQHLYWLFLISKNLTKLFIYYCVNGVMVLYYKRVTFMAYFLKKSNLKKGTYLQIYESFYDSAKKQTAQIGRASCRERV